MTSVDDEPANKGGLLRAAGGAGRAVAGRGAGDDMDRVGSVGDGGAGGGRGRGGDRRGGGVVGVERRDGGKGERWG